MASPGTAGGYIFELMVRLVVDRLHHRRQRTTASVGARSSPLRFLRGRPEGTERQAQLTHNGCASWAPSCARAGLILDTSTPAQEDGGWCETVRDDVYVMVRGMPTLWDCSIGAAELVEPAQRQTVGSEAIRLRLGMFRMGCSFAFHSAMRMIATADRCPA
jgi:hypothetical protein